MSSMKANEYSLGTNLSLLDTINVLTNCISAGYSFFNATALSTVCIYLEMFMENTGIWFCF